VLERVIKERILVLDGALGTLTESYGIRTGNTDELSLTHPEIICDIHRRYLAAGADIITTNTFSSQRISQADYHLEDKCYDMALAGARLARACADEYSTAEKPRFVAGSVGPTNKTASLSPDVNNPAAREITYNELFDAYKEQIAGLVDGGADAILIETVFDTLNCKAAIDAANQTMETKGKKLPLMVSVAVSDMAGRTLSGQTLEAFLSTLSSYDIFSVGLNCSMGARQMKPFLKQLASRAPYYISAYPNAGLPNELGKYDETADTMLPQIEEYIDEGLVNIIGGCCGTDDTFIRKYAEMVSGRMPHQVHPRYRQLHLSGLSSFVPQENTFTNVGERCNVAGSRKFLRLINEKNYEEALSIARKQVEDGALVLDINMDDALLDAKEEMVHFVNLIASEPDIAAVPLMIDSSDWNVIEAGLGCIQGKCIVNSISLKEGEDVFVSHAKTIKRFGAAVVVMCFDEVGQATTFDRKIEIAGRAYRILTEQVGMNPLDIIFDPNILSIATGIKEHDNYAVDFIKATRWIRENCPGAHVSGGVSNLSFAFRGNNYLREAMHAAFLYNATRAGMDFGIVNPATKVTYSDIPENQLRLIEDVVLNRHEGATEALLSRISEFVPASQGNGSIDGSTVENWRDGKTIEDRLCYSLRKGISEHLEEDLKEALTIYPQAVDIIEGPLMKGMNEVGLLFGEGKMFLPQVIKTARTMKKAVAILQPYIEQQKTVGSAKAGKVVIATVKGDVHDIGKNIVAVVMACNNFEVIDLGVMVSAETIIATAKREHADMVCMSGLITPSLGEMVNVVREMQHEGLTIPVIVGGATTSELHVALKIAPEYDGIVMWSKDAAQNAVLATRMMNPADRETLVSELKRKYELMREEYNSRQKQTLVPIEEARKRSANIYEAE
jgi:5-methyltetrahydrofolate--homocysteine methyltransferase